MSVTLEKISGNCAAFKVHEKGLPEHMIVTLGQEAREATSKFVGALGSKVPFTYAFDTLEEALRYLPVAVHAGRMLCAVQCGRRDNYELLQQEFAVMNDRTILEAGLVRALCGSFDAAQGYLNSRLR